MNILKRTSNGMNSTFYVNPKSYNGQHLDYEKSYWSGFPQDIIDLKQLVSTVPFENNDAIKVLNRL